MGAACFTTPRKHAAVVAPEPQSASDVRRPPDPVDAPTNDDHPRAMSDVVERPAASSTPCHSNMAPPGFPLHERARTGDEVEMLILLLESRDPFGRDDFNNLALYYSSLNGHLRCCAWLLVAMGGVERIPRDEALRCATNALTVEIKQLMLGKTNPTG